MQETNMKQTVASVEFLQITRRYIPDDRILRSHSCENLKLKIPNISQTICSCLTVAPRSVNGLEFCFFPNYSSLTLLLSHVTQDSGYDKLIELCLY